MVDQDLHVISEQEIKLHRRLREATDSHEAHVMFDWHGASATGPTDDDELVDPVFDVIRTLHSLEAR